MAEQIKKIREEIKKKLQQIEDCHQAKKNLVEPKLIQKACS